MTTHRHAANNSVSGEYKAWQNMKQRCRNTKNPHFKNYCGRGIDYCDRWEKFENFLEDMGPRPLGMTLERINNDAGYCKENCLWADRVAQGNNRRDNVLIEIEGQINTIAEWARIKNVPVSVIAAQVSREEKRLALLQRLEAYRAPKTG